MHKESNQSSQEEEDIFRKLGVELPGHLNTESRRWFVLLLVTLLSILALGPLMSWPTLEPLLIQEGVWAGKNQVANLSKVMGIALLGIQMFGIPLGILYDALGPRALSALGACGVGVSLGVMALAVQVQHLNFLLWVAFPTCVVVGALGSTVGSYAWLWLLPNHSGLVISIIGVVQILSDSLALIAVGLNKSCGMRIQVYFAFLGGVSLCVAPILLMLIPPQKELLRISHIVMSQSSTSTPQDSSRDYGATGDYHIDKVPASLEETPAPTVREAFQKGWVALIDTCTLCCKICPTISFLFFSYQAAQYVLSVYVGTNLFPIYLDLVGKAKAVELVDLLPVVVSLSGVVWMFSVGWFSDRFGLAATTGWFIVPTFLVAIALSSTSIGFQLVGQATFVLLSNAWRVLQVRFAQVYGPPELFGTVFGAFGLPCVVAQLTLMPLCNWIFQNQNAGGSSAGWQLILGRWGSQFALPFDLPFIVEHGPNPNVLPTLRAIDCWCIITVVFTLLSLLYWRYDPLPAIGSTTMADIRNFGVDLDVERNAMETEISLESKQPICKPPEQPSCKPPKQPNCTTKRCTSAGDCCACFKINQV